MLYADYSRGKVFSVLYFLELLEVFVYPWRSHSVVMVTVSTYQVTSLFVGNILLS